MGISNLTAAASGLSSAIRSIQRGSAVSAGTVTISSVDTTKARVTSFSTGAAGNVAIAGNVNAANGSQSAVALNVGASSGSTGLNSWARGAGNAQFSTGPYAGSGPFNSVNGSVNFSGGSGNIAAGTVGLNAQNISAGATNLITAVYGAYLTNATTLTVTGPCRYEVVEYY